MYVKNVTKKAKEQQISIESALFECLKNRMFEDITVVDLCEKAGVTRRVFYRLYQNKLGALQGLLDHTIGEFVKSQEKFDRIRLVSVLEFVKEQRDLFDCIIKNGLSELYQDRLLIYVLENDHLKEKLGFSDVYDGHSVLLFNLSGMMGLLIYWHQTDYEKTIQEMANLIVRLLAKPIINK